MYEAPFLIKIKKNLKKINKKKKFYFEFWVDQPETNDCSQGGVQWDTLY